MSVVSKKSGKIFEGKYCEHVITEVKFFEDQNEAAFTGENQSMIIKSCGKQRSTTGTCAARLYDYGFRNQFEYSFTIQCCF